MTKRKIKKFLILFGILGLFFFYFSPANAITATYYPSKDNELSQEYPNTVNPAGTTRLDVGYQANIQDHFNIILDFDLSNIPDGATFTQGDLMLYVYGNYNANTSRTIYASRITQLGWTEAGASWNKYDGINAWATPGGDFTTTNQASYTGVAPNPGWLTLSSPALIQDSWNNQSKHVNIIVRQPGTENSYAVIYSREYTDSSLRPKLIVTYTLPNTPSISSYTNNTESALTDGGRINQQITISGSNFGTACDGTNNVVKIGTYSVPCVNVSTWTATSISFTIPSDINVYGGTGSNGLIVRANGTDSNSSTFYIYPSISSLITPSVANAFREGDTGIQINGSRFGTATSTVFITLSGQSAVSSTITTWSDTQITITIPTALVDTIDTGTLNLSRASDSKTSNNWNIRVLPQITSLNPTSGIVGTVVNINGTHLGSDPGVGYRSTATDNIKFGSTQALESDISSWSATLIQVKVPSGVSAGTNTVVVRRNNYDSNSSSFSATVSFTQKDFRWYTNIDSLQPVDPWPSGATDLAENAAISGVDSPPINGDVLRLRINITIGSVNLAAGSQSFKLQFATSSGSCASTTNWSDVDAINGSGVWRGYNNNTPADGAVLSGLLLSTSNATATYEEANNSANNPYAVSVGQNIEYDWVIQDNNAPSGTTYCFRMIKSDGTTLNSYTNYPSLITKGLPNAPTNLGQYLADGTTAVAVGGTASTQTIVLKMTMSGVGSGIIYPQVEVKPITQPFDGSTNIFEGNGVSYSGSPVTGQVNLTSSQLYNHTAFHWRARTRMNTDYSTWVSFGNNAD